MTAASNTEAVRELLLASNRGDVDAFVDHLHPEVEWQSVGLFLHPAQLWRGHAALRRGMDARTAHHGGHPQVTLRELAERGDRVLAVAAIAIPRARRPAILPVAWIFELSDRLVLRARTFTTEQHARAEWAQAAPTV